ncbi:hypothetical protein GGQ68_003352 [Sagittula marina]|uniref:Uncharacterized protein n=1 Tax=Sagittula marina TaxID=943940 RepID=A0A7W6DPY0_9RHOB|nr:hypothetical protein [Sagittula marina]
MSQLPCPAIPAKTRGNRVDTLLTFPLHDTAPRDTRARRKTRSNRA